MFKRISVTLNKTRDADLKASDIVHLYVRTISMPTLILIYANLYPVFIPIFYVIII